MKNQQGFQKSVKFLNLQQILQNLYKKNNILFNLYSSLFKSNQMQQKSSHNTSFYKKLNTDRSQRACTSRNYETITDNHSNMYKNISQIIQKQTKQINKRQVQRKKSLSSFYFKNYKKNNKKQIIQQFGKFLKNKKQTTIYNNQKRHQGKLNRKRCITVANLTTNKICNRTEQSLSRQKYQKIHKQHILVTQINIEEQKQMYCGQKTNLLNNPINNCINHPLKRGYFQQLQSFNCYCHQCSIKNVKNNNMRLISMNPQIKQIKRIIKDKLQQNQQCANRLCEQIMRNICELNRGLQVKYYQFKKERTNLQSQNIKNMDLTLKQISWDNIFVNGINNKLQLQTTPLKCLVPSERKYIFNYTKNEQKQQQKSTQKVQLNQMQNISQISLRIQSNSKKRSAYKKVDLFEQIHKVLYQKESHKTKLPVNKKITLKSNKHRQTNRNSINEQKSLIDQELQFYDKQNVSPNIQLRTKINQKRISSYSNGNQFKELERISFGMN